MPLTPAQRLGVLAVLAVAWGAVALATLLILRTADSRWTPYGLATTAVVLGGRAAEYHRGA